MSNPTIQAEMETYRDPSGQLIKAVFLDRDGVLVKTYPEGGTTRGPLDMEEVVILPGVAEAVRRLRENDWIVIGVTNTPDVARGRLLPVHADQINGLISQMTRIRDLLSCPHDRHQQFSCRKPMPGMLFAAAYKWGVSLPNSWMVGDRETDRQAARRAGCHSILLKPTGHLTNLTEATQWILDHAP